MVKALTPYREELAARVDGGQRMLVTGNALDALGEYVQSDQGLRFDGLGLLPTHAEYQMMNRHNSFFSGDLWHRDGDRGLQESVRPHLRRRRSRHGAF